jgi:DNA-binding transcriptional ArsR family regulator
MKSINEKIAIGSEYLGGEYTFQELADKYGVSQASVRRWALLVEAKDLESLGRRQGRRRQYAAKTIKRRKQNESDNN